ncbi:hypothetical protein DFH09DRAFT_1351461 [Mycena vulgaris]|nr:hypothetical protein DFH09DRAFT_1351461 [Mycena vulgaris]
MDPPSLAATRVRWKRKASDALSHSHTPPPPTVSSAVSIDNASPKHRSIEQNVTEDQQPPLDEWMWCEALLAPPVDDLNDLAITMEGSNVSMDLGYSEAGWSDGETPERAWAQISDRDPPTILCDHSNPEAGQLWDYATRRLWPIHGTYHSAELDWIMANSLHCTTKQMGVAQRQTRLEMTASFTKPRHNKKLTTYGSPVDVKPSIKVFSPEHFPVWDNTNLVPTPTYKPSAMDAIDLLDEELEKDAGTVAQVEGSDAMRKVID